MSLNLLIVEGRSEAILRANENTETPFASSTYARSLAVHEPCARFDTLHPYAPFRDEGLLPLDAYDGFVLTGSSVAWGAEMPEARPYIRAIEPLLASGKPVLGSCWGLQTVCVLLGGMSGPNPGGSEIGIAREIVLTAEGRQHPLFDGMPDCFDSPAMHRDHVTRLPDNAVLLASNAVSEVQAISYQANGVDYMGFQFHPEIPLDLIKSEYEKRAALPGTIKDIADFPEAVPDSIADRALRTRPLANWTRHVRERSNAMAIAAE